MKKNICLLLFFVMLFLFPGCIKKEKAIVINTDEYAVRFSLRGEFVKLEEPSLKLSRHFRAYSCMEQCRLVVDTFFMIPTGGVEFYKRITKTGSGDSAFLVERFVPAEHCLIWQIEIEGGGQPWTTGIQTVLELDDVSSLLFWTPWGSPEQLAPASTSREVDNTWYDPFTPRPFRNMHLVYGGHPMLGGGYSVPLVSIFERYRDAGFTLLMSTYDPLLDVSLQTTPEGKIIQTRRNNRIEKGKKLVFTTLVYFHRADWRDVMKKAVERYNDDFIPRCMKAGEVSGCGAYSSRDDADGEKYKKMGGIVLWKASFDFPYMGMFIPEVKSGNEKWKRIDCNSAGEIIPRLATYTSIDQMYASFASLREKGFHPLAYFNMTEFGAGIEYPVPEHTKTYAFPVYKKANQFLYQNFPSALVFGAFESKEGWLFRTGEQHLYPRAVFYDRPYHSWCRSVVMDCGDSAYASFLLRQAEIHIKNFRDMEGICIDRMDWLGEYNWKADDGLSMIENRPVRSLLTSWKRMMMKLGPLMHKDNKVIFCNPHIHRIELMTHVDGVFDEQGFMWDNMNLSSFLCLYKPLIVWTPEGRVVDSAGVHYFEYQRWNGIRIRERPDDYLQKILYMGAFPMAPFPGNDHSLNPDSVMEKYFLDYGPLFALLHEREYVLEPHVIAVEKDKALVNFFVTPLHYVAPVIYGNSGNVTVMIHYPALLDRSYALQIRALYPGEQREELLNYRVEDNVIYVEVPLKRRCAVLKIDK